MDSLLKRDQINYQVLGDSHNILQVLLLSSQVLYTDIIYIIYNSPGLSFREIPVPIWKRFTFSVAGFKHRIKNRKDGVEYIGLSKSSGKILAVNPYIIEDTFIVNKNFILAYTSGISLSNAKNVNALMKKIDWREIKGNGIFFLQGFGSIIEKRLGNDEEICVNKNEIIAYSKEIRVNEYNTFRSYRAFFIHDWCLMKLKGPGTVFIEGSARSRSSSISPTRKNDILHGFLLFLLFMMIFGLEILLKI
jgi:uncharacterized protein (AIM24 family)